MKPSRERQHLINSLKTINFFMYGSTVQMTYPSMQGELSGSVSLDKYGYGRFEFIDGVTKQATSYGEMYRAWNGDIELTFSNLGIRARITPYGERTIQISDGSTIVLKRDGTESTIWADGSKEKREADGTVTKLDRDGTITTRHADGTQVTLAPDGMKTTVKPDGATIWTRPDKTIVARTPEGVKTTYWPNGTEVILTPDGTKTTLKPDGTKIVLAPNGDKTTITPGEVILTVLGVTASVATIAQVILMISDMSSRKSKKVKTDASNHKTDEKWDYVEKIEVQTSDGNHFDLKPLVSNFEEAKSFIEMLMSPLLSPKLARVTFFLKEGGKLGLNFGAHPEEQEKVLARLNELLKLKL